MKKALLHALKGIPLLLALLCCSQKALATHIVGGEMNYRCLGNDQYEVSLTVFRDCDTGVPWFDDPASIGVFDGQTNVLIFSQLVDLDAGINDTLDIYLPDSCLIVPNNVCIHTTTYTDTFTLPFSLTGYTLAYQRCCRNQDIVNIVNPNSTGATYWTYISPAALQLCNSSAVFNEWPRVYLCSRVPIAFDHSATDVDGDSIVYELCTPSDGATNANARPQPPNAPPYQNITWQAPYGVSNVLGGPDPLSIDPVTGLLTGTPQNLGVFLVGVCLKEYRNGNLISITRRDFQHVVGTCEPQTVADFDTTGLQCNKVLTYPFDNDSRVVTGSYNWIFDTLGTSQAVNPIFTFPDTGLYTVTLVAGIGSPCLDTFSVDMDIRIEALELSMAAPQTACQGDTILLVATDTYEGYSDSTTFTWSPAAAIISGQGTDSVWVVVNQSTQFRVDGVNNYGCTSSAFATINIRQVTADFTTTSTPCNTSLTLQFQNQSSSNPTNNNYQWQFGTLGFATATNPFFVFPDTGTYTVTLVAGVGSLCADTISRNVLVQLTAMELQPIPDVTACKGDSIFIKAIDLYKDYSTSANYVWTPSSEIVTGQGTDSVLIIANNSTQIQVSGQNNYGCPSTLSFDIDVIHIEANFDTLDLACNTSLAIPFTNSSINSLGGSNYLWRFDTLATSAATNPIYTFPDTGMYAIELIVGANTLCPDTMSLDLYLPLYGVDLTPIPAQTACVGDSLWLTVDDLLERYSDSIDYVWTPTSQIIEGQGTDSVLILATNTTTIKVEALNSHLCRDTVATTINVLEVNASFDTLDVLCNTSLLVPFVNTSTSNLTMNNYEWNFENLATSTDVNPLYNFPDTGNYTVRLVAGVGSLCPDTFNMEVYLPLHGLIMDAPDVSVICKEDTVELTVTNALDAYTDWVNYQWLPTNEIFAGQGTDTAYALMDTNTTFIVIGNNAHGCVDTAYAQGRIIYISPILTTTVNPDSIFVGQTAQLATTNDINYLYNWLPDTTLDNYFIYNPMAKPRQTTWYFVSATNQYGCTTKDSVLVPIKAPVCGLPTVFIPNAFSPDGDGHNDVLMINGNNIARIDWTIYNRWGEKVFESNDQAIGWNGTFKGKTLPPDVYGYYLRCICDDGSELLTKGNITLLR
ncbi:gliding motility-associated C-terminal domain-containing protein [Aureispira sp. CCB-QB1]|uniref:T9SS type B sorting domain-containing protein n=1 Tax=Aureispira sp. CCB-QB1 TaxID=1313421 RepID=UPI0006986398|nr:gliding motility-associated C-terminal domain-containing protein [Aureispira sp. CCB-QB1]